MVHSCWASLSQARLREEQRVLEARASAAVAGHFAHLSASMGVEDVRQMERAWAEGLEGERP